MNDRITNKTLDAIATRINNLTKSPLKPYAPHIEGQRVIPQAGNYHISHAYGGVCLHRMSMTQGCTGVTDVFRCGHIKKRYLAERMWSYLDGLNETTETLRQHALASDAYIPTWLVALLGVRELRILAAPDVQFLQVDNEGNRLPSHQQWIESNLEGRFWVDAQVKQIIG